MPQPPRTAHLDELERVPGPDSLTWLPVRATLGVRAFGTNAYVAAEAGDDVVEPHDEDPTLAHEELYFVARGHARFTIDGDELDAPAGTYVLVPDPASRRHAIAVEPGTRSVSRSCARRPRWTTTSPASATISASERSCAERLRPG